MCRDRRRHYDDGFMRVVADLIRGGAGRRSLARRLGVPVSTAGKWVLSYRFGGEAALMGVCVQLVVAGLVTMIFRV